MTFLLQKFNAINRTRTEGRAWNGLRPTAGGIAFTGRLAACLLLAGFLGVGSAIAQAPPTVLRVGGGSAGEVALGTANADGNNNTLVHHYVINPGDNQVVVNDPLNGQNSGLFIAGTIATVMLANGMVTVTPIAAGVLKIAGDRAVSATPAGTTDDAAPVLFEIMSTGSPYIVDADDGDGNDDETYNEEVQGLVHETVILTLRDDASKEIKDIDDIFSGGSGLRLTYSAKADPVMREDPDDEDEMISVDIVTASVSGKTLTIALTEDAAANDMETAVWLFAHDSRGEYARLRIKVGMVLPAVQAYVAKAMGDQVYRENDAGSMIDAFDLDSYDKDGTSTPRFTDGAGGRTNDLYYSVTTDPVGTAVPNAGADEYTFVGLPILASITQGEEGASLDITDIRDVGMVEVTVSATDFFTCPTGYAANEDGTAPTMSAEDVCNKITATNAGVHTLDKTDQKDSFADYDKGDSYSFTITVITRTTPKADVAIDAVTLVADGDSMMVDLEDLNGDKAKEPAAFEDPTDNGLTYTVVLDPEGVATASVDSSVITFAPIWHGDEKAKVTTATVTAENEDGETQDSEVSVTVTHAVSPVVSDKVAGALALGFGLVLKTTDRAMTVDLENLMVPNPLDPTMMVAVGPVFMNPLPKSMHGSLPGGLLYEMEVAADFKSPESTKNNVITSAMTITLDPGAKPTLMVTPYGANSAVVTLTATNRAEESTPAMVTVPVMVVSCDGVDMSGPCDGVTVGTENEELPTEVALSQNYPNPFNPQTTIDYALPQAGDVSLIVYDMLGREVDVLLDGPQAAGWHTVRFGANHLPNGTYVYRLVAADKTITRTMVLVK